MFSKICEMNLGKIERIEKLNSTNYETWKIQMKSVLRYNDLWGYVTGTVPKPEENDGDWTMRDEKALDVITLSIQSDQYNYIKRANTSMEAWEMLKGIYESRRPMRQCVLFNQLYRLKKSTEQNMSQYINEFVRIAEQLEECDMKLPENLLSVWLLNSLPSEYETISIAIQSRDGMPTLEELKTRLLEEEARKLESTRDQEAEKEEALLTKRKGGYKNITSKDHTKPSQGKKMFKCFNCGKTGHMAKNCRSNPRGKNMERRDDAMTAIALNTGLPRSGIWCLDSGATTHMCNDSSRFNGLNRNETTKIYTAAEDCVKSEGKGEVNIKVQAEGNKPNDIRLQEAMLVPTFKSNLLSVSSITKHGYKVTFQKEYAVVTRKDGSVAMRATMTDGLYVVNENSPEYAGMSKIHKNNLTKWHNRLGHLNFNDLKRMKNMVLGMNENMDEKIEKCEVCDKCKIHQLPFKSSTRREKRVLGLVHSDICGPMHVASLGGARYFVSFIDDKTRYTEVAMLKNKSDVFKAFQEYKSKAEKLTGQLITKLRTDNAKEYLSKEFTSYLKSEGITRELSVAYTPQQNGVAERSNRTLVEMARCMLLQAKAPFTLWAEAVNAAAYIRNRCPTKALDEYTPYEGWTGKKPYVGFMRIFGSRVIALNKRHRYNKFAPKGKEFVLVGYSEESKAYRLWERGSRTVEKYRDVRFLEDQDIESSNNEETFFEVPLDQSTTDESDDEQEVQQQEDGPEQELPTITETPTTRRGPGRPRIERTGKRGRPRKIFHTHPKGEHAPAEPSTITEAMSTSERED